MAVTLTPVLDFSGNEGGALNAGRGRGSTALIIRTGNCVSTAASFENSSIFTAASLGTAEGTLALGREGRTYRHALILEGGSFFLVLILAAAVPAPLCTLATSGQARNGIFLNTGQLIFALSRGTTASRKGEASSAAFNIQRSKI